MLPNTSTMRIFTNNAGSAASAKAAVDPTTPTQTPQSKLQMPTVKPPQKSAYPERESLVGVCSGRRGDIKWEDTDTDR